LYNNFTLFFSFWGTPTGALPLVPLGDLRPLDPLAMPPQREPLHYKILGMSGQPSDTPQPGASKGTPGDAKCDTEISGDKTNKEICRGNLPFRFKGT